jgi:glyoxalase family protein
VTAISGPPQANVDFYTRKLKQRLVKRTVNFDDPGTYHLYYGDQTGSPGTILTFFPFVDAGPGRAGAGMADAVAYAASPADFDAWMDRLALEAHDFDGPVERFGRRVITLRDPDGLAVEIAESEGADQSPLDGFFGVTLWLADPAPTAHLLIEHFGYSEVGEEPSKRGSRLRLAAPGGARGAQIDLKRDDAPSLGRQGAGTIHHVAFRARDDDEQRGWRERLLTAGYDVTPVIDRQYFNAIYFREPGGVLFEIATDPPGFAVDEPVETLGRALKLPTRFEPMRERIERSLPPIKLPE